MQATVSHSLEYNGQRPDELVELVFNHGRRVARLAFRIARQLGDTAGEAVAIAEAACLHDIGKLLVDWETLFFPGPLSPSGRAMVEEHAQRGAGLLEVLSGDGLADRSLAIQVALHHHERWNGDGYPQGLAGNAIPRPARVVAAADVYDALTSRRSYKPAWSPEQALRFIVGRSGVQFDPAVVVALLEVLSMPRRWRQVRSLAVNWEAGAEALYRRAQGYSDRFGTITARCYNVLPMQPGELIHACFAAPARDRFAAAPS